MVMAFTSTDKYVLRLREKAPPAHERRRACRVGPIAGGYGVWQGDTLLAVFASEADAEQAARNPPEEPKTCSRCKVAYPKGSFPTTTCHGRRIRRSWCQACLTAYYKIRDRRRSTDDASGTASAAG